MGNGSITGGGVGNNSRSLIDDSDESACVMGGGSSSVDDDPETIKPLLNNQNKMLNVVVGVDVGDVNNSKKYSDYVNRMYALNNGEDYNGGGATTGGGSCRGVDQPKTTTQADSDEIRPLLGKFVEVC